MHIVIEDFKVSRNVGVLYLDFPPILASPISSSDWLSFRGLVIGISSALSLFNNFDYVISHFMLGGIQFLAFSTLFSADFSGILTIFGF